MVVLMLLFQPRIMIMKELKKELMIDHDTHSDCQKRVKTDTLVLELRYLDPHARE